MAEQPFTSIVAHEETGNRFTYDRDLAVFEWAAGAGVSVTELTQTGVVRRLGSRDGWARTWKERMSLPMIHSPTSANGCDAYARGQIPTSADFGLDPQRRPLAMRGGEERGRRVLDSFLHKRGVDYRAAMSSPLEGWDSCSRISSYITWGQLSVRTAWQAARDRLDELDQEKELSRKPAAGPDVPRVPAPDKRWQPSVRSFEKRLAWHCHFMQKLEDEPDIEFRNMNRAFDGLRAETMSDLDRQRFAAFRAGQTGYPLVDACIRALAQSGWINFRMRAMLASFTAYHLWLHWREPAVWMASQFQDFEPGIHYSQYQMQSGVTGINTIRIYSPIKQAQEQDPDGEFIRKFVPELADVPAVFLAEPHRMPPLTQLQFGVHIGADYPDPIVDHTTAYKAAKEQAFSWKSRPVVREFSQAVYQKHGSRKRPRDRM
jgi:deoxyribodipyrimidine photo-lyase